MDTPPDVVHGVLDALPINVAVLDGDAVIVYSNAAWQEFGEREGIAVAPDTVGVNYLDVCDAAADEGDKDAGRAAEGIRRVLSDDTDSFGFEYPCHSPTARRWFVMHASGFEHDGERYVAVAHFDVTRRRLSEEKTERRNRALSEFAHAVSHDLRNPLTVAMGNLAMAREDDDTEALRKTAVALERIDELIDGMLERAESGEIAMDLADIAVTDAARDAWENVATGDASFAVEGGEDLVVEADREQLLRLFENLFRNAVEHGGEETAVRLGTVDAGFYVEDDGRGVDDAVLPYLFETGMGLKTVRDVAEAHGWEVRYEESDDGGARFVFDVRPATPTTTY